MYPKITLKKEKERSVQRFHPWIFSGALHTFSAELEDGDIVSVVDFKGNFLCIGHFFKGSIAVKILSFKNEIINQAFWNQKIKNAVQ
ncbi:MAG TPA: class I SAM-dependent rRNA methyltransferase, partial [Chitinophagales bacterium]|nr:class I SAM-dependent rRNA methyltransferase [Chitinophagales bacterium]